MERVERLEVRDADGSIVTRISAQDGVAAFFRTLNGIDGWFDDIFPREGAVAYVVDIIENGKLVGSLGVERRHLHYVPGKNGVKISRREYNDLLQSLGLDQGTRPGPQ